MPATMETFRQMLDTLSPEEREQLLDALTASYGTQEQELAERGYVADDLANTAAPGMRNAGRFRIAANPLEHLAAGGHRALGEHQRRGVRRERRAMGQRQQDALKALQNLYTRPAAGRSPLANALASAGPPVSGLGVM